MRAAVPLIALALAACSQPATKPADKASAPAEAAKAEPITAPAGEYRIDPDHTSINFRVSHLGFSKYTARFTDFTGKLAFDPANPAAQSVEATIDARSVQTNYKGPPKEDFDTVVETQFLHADQHPQITFRSTRVETTGPRSARVTGDLTLNGVTRPVTLETSFNGGYAPNAMDGARIGFSARGTFRRSDFGITYGLPAPGTNMGVFDEVEVIIETELTSGQPVAAGAPVAAK
jgi:polyisoprenoid-binding protein YceI